MNPQSSDMKNDFYENPTLSEKQANEKGSQKIPKALKVIALISSLTLLVLLILWTDENGNPLKGLKLGDQQTTKDKSIVVGVEDTMLHSDYEKRHTMGKIPIGTEVKVHQIGWKSVKVSVPDLGEGWVYRWQLCSLSELQKRKAKNYVPKSISWVSHVGTDKITRRGIRTGTFPTFLDEVVISAPGIAYWLDQSWKGHECKIGRTMVTHEMNTAFMRNGTKKPVLRLNILPWSSSEKSGI